VKQIQWLFNFQHVSRILPHKPVKLPTPNRNPPEVRPPHCATLRTCQREVVWCRVTPPRERAAAGTVARTSSRTPLHPRRTPFLCQRVTLVDLNTAQQKL